MRNPENWALPVTGLPVLTMLAGPYPTAVELAKTAVGLAGRALLAAVTVWLAITLLQPRGRTPEVTR